VQRTTQERDNLSREYLRGPPEMCGIAGVVHPDGQAVSAGLLERMAATLAHRGPDGEGRFIQGNVGLVHRRLSIIDVDGGKQPLSAEGAVLVANGEIYNYLELRDELKVACITHSDCELPLYLYSRCGLKYINRLRGMYAVALYDGHRLVLSRDPFGIKPVYYVRSNGSFIFASQPSALLATGMVKRSLERNALVELLQLQFTTGSQTIFPEVRRVLPGETLVVEAGRITAAARQPAPMSQEPQPTTLNEALTKFESVMLESVMVHLRADVPCGLFLSGGIDSSVLLALMARIVHTPVKTFTVGFSNTDAADEREAARAIACCVGAEHVEVEFSEDDFWELLPQVTAAMDDPAADYAILPTFKLAREASKGLKVILSGEGGDELFAGYGRYRRAMRPWWLAGRKMHCRGIFDGLGVLRIDTHQWRKGITASERVEASWSRRRLQTAQNVDCADWLPNDVLAKLDRCLMAHGVEGRTPFLDAKVAQFACSLPDDLKIRHRLGKWLLREWLDKNLPAARAFEPKQGFTVPVGEWIARQGNRVGALVARQDCVREICNRGEVERVFNSSDPRARSAAWILLFYSLWYRCHILGLRPEGSVFDCLCD
jgi:asparagine synthase (glutamine-hydrolysing)